MMTLIDIVSSKRKAEILRLLFGVEGGELHLREIARRSRLALGTVQHELARLVKIGLVNSRRDGNRVCYRANRNSPVFPWRNPAAKAGCLVWLARLAHEGPTVPCCGRLGRAAARPYRIGAGRDDLPVVRVPPEGFMSQPCKLVETHEKFPVDKGHQKV